MTRIGGEKGGKRRRWRSEARVEDDGLRVALAILGSRVADARKAAGLTQEALASTAMLDVRHVQDIEYGKANVTFATLRAIAIGLGKSVSEITKEIV